MTEKYEIIFKYIQDLSVEIPSAETFMISREHITKYVLSININTKTLKNKMLEVITKLTFKDPNEKNKRCHFEISYATVIKIKDEKMQKNELEKVLLCDVQKEVYPEIEKILIKTIKDAGFPALKLDKKIDFDLLYRQRTN
ncbi:protein-export chaperone SecB [Candidatus Pelagibacter sp.]|nr:protein-export chaperone SecB [Candidatus Pelagibacter sp.]